MISAARGGSYSLSTEAAPEPREEEEEEKEDEGEGIMLLRAKTSVCGANNILFTDRFLVLFSFLAR